MVEGEVIVYSKGKQEIRLCLGLFLGLVLVLSLDYIETLIDHDCICHQPRILVMLFSSYTYR